MKSTRELIYLDHGATSWPKPDAVQEGMVGFLASVAANAGRSGHRASYDSARLMFDVREGLASLLGVPDSKDLVFTRGATEGLNLVLKGFLKPGDRVLVSPLEHNSVMRPLAWLKEDRDVQVDVLPADAFGRVDAIEAAKCFGNTGARLLVLAHGSNVTGVVQDLPALRQAFPDTAILVDAAQTAGVVPIDVSALPVDFLACSAHKGLLGPTGVGACYLDPKHEVEPLLQGGTGSRSEATEQPTFRPDRYESGTMNLHGIAGFRGALRHIEKYGLSGDAKRKLASLLASGLSEIPGLCLHSPDDGTALLVSFTLENLKLDRITAALEGDHGILCRPGLHCAPTAHRHLGTFPDGTIRFSPGYGNTEEQMERAVRAVAAIAKSG